MTIKEFPEELFYALVKLPNRDYSELVFATKSNNQRFFECNKDNPGIKIPLVEIKQPVEFIRWGRSMDV